MPKHPLKTKKFKKCIETAYNQQESIIGTFGEYYGVGGYSIGPPKPA